MTFLKRANILFDKHPYKTQAFVAGVLQITGDVIAQKFIEKRSKIKKRRLANALLLGCFKGAVLRKWYGIMDTRFKNANPLKNAVVKVAGEKFFNTFSAS
jgi:hypothetical protein